MSAALERDERCEAARSGAPAGQAVGGAQRSGAEPEGLE